jgi:hypothetical protein
MQKLSHGTRAGRGREQPWLRAKQAVSGLLIPCGTRALIMERAIIELFWRADFALVPGQVLHDYDQKL